MIIGEVTGTAQTFGGYVNVSRQIIDWTTPQVMDIIIGDLAAQYAVVTENDATDTFLAAATAATTNLATGTNTAAQVAAAFWGAVGQVYSGTKGAGRVIAAMPPQMLGLVGPLFAPVNPENAQSPGFSAVNYGQGPAGVDQRCPDLRHRRTRRQQDPRPLHRSRGGLRRPHRRPVSVVEPSVLGVQVAYARPLHAAGHRRARDHRDHQDAMSELWDDPNRQAVGLDPAGSSGDAAQPQAAEEPRRDDQGRAARRRPGTRRLSPPTRSMTKDEIRESIDNA